VELSVLGVPKPMPPVEAPMATTVSVGSRWMPVVPGRDVTGSGARLRACGGVQPDSVVLRVMRGGPTFAWAAARTTSSKPLSSRAPEGNTRGFGRTSTAPAASARIASIVPGSANPEQTTTGIGSVAMICLRKVMPSMRGISRSRTITWGR